MTPKRTDAQTVEGFGLHFVFQPQGSLAQQFSKFLALCSTGIGEIHPPVWPNLFGGLTPFGPKCEWWVFQGRLFINRSRAIQEAVQEILERLERGRLAKECLNLDPTQEKALAEEGLFEDLATWPK